MKLHINHFSIIMSHGTSPVSTTCDTLVTFLSANIHGFISLECAGICNVIKFIKAKSIQVSWIASISDTTEICCETFSICWHSAPISYTITICYDLLLLISANIWFKSSLKPWICNMIGFIFGKSIQFNTNSCQDSRKYKSFNNFLNINKKQYWHGINNNQNNLIIEIHKILEICKQIYEMFLVLPIFQSHEEPY